MLSLGDTVAARKFAKWYIPSVRIWTNSTLYASLSDSRSDEEKTDIMEQFWIKYENKVAEAPEEHGNTYVYACVRITKT